MTPCPSRAQLQALLAGQLSGTAQDEIENHVRICSGCEHALTALLHDEETEQWRHLLAAGKGALNPQPVPGFLGRLKDGPPTIIKPTLASEAPAELAGSTIGKYHIIRELASGAFGRVCLARDPEMNRPVAVKIPTAALLATHQAREQFVHEAQSVAGLRHAGIVGVHDFGQEPGGRCYIVYDYIEGQSLAERLKDGPLPPRDAALLVAQVADALHYAHLNSLIHRDVKPANILLDVKGRPFVTDFGIAVREEDLARERGSRAGTPHYMSPEQARCEGHLIDGRTDIYSLGVVFYEALCGQRPFQAATLADLYDLILNREARPPRQVHEAIPRELERICLKAMAKRITDRYTTMEDMAEELRLAVSIPASTPLPGGSSILRHAGTAGVVPRGLRSFGPEDADFFLELLPGPRDREGLPEAIKFWKVRVDATEPDRAFRVGLIHGPSGCGKTSLIRAGLLPRLARNVVPIYVEALREGTEARLLSKLRSAFAEVQPAPSLAAAMALLRLGIGLEPGQKVLIVLDQLEQWLLAQGAGLDTQPLTAALRQADGCHVQVLLMVRDDFWSACSRLFEALEIAMDNESNVRMVDLFDPVHARKVLEFFGHAYDRLPARRADLSREHNAFLDDVVEGLSQDGKVISVRLSLFADMMKARPWTPHSLKAVGGTRGVGVKFLEETFSASFANPEHRQDEKPARGLLAALLPDAGGNIKGQMCPRADLLRASGLENAPRRFERLLKMLDQELRIITPTEAPASPVASAPGESASPVAPAMASASPVAPAPGDLQTHPPSPESFYQLTHDYLVAPLREWLTQKKRETWRGRAELCLEERTAHWSRTRDSRFLPSTLEYLRILLAVPRSRYKPEQRALVRAASFTYGLRGGIVLALLALLGWGAWEIHGTFQASGLVQAICSAEPAEAEKLVESALPPYRRWAEPMLRAVAIDPREGPARRLRASLACLPEQADYLAGRLLDCSVAEFAIIRNRLTPYRGPWLAEFWKKLRDAHLPDAPRFRSGLALAAFASEATGWTEADADFLAQQLLVANPDDQHKLRSYLLPWRERLRGKIREKFQSLTLGQAAAAALVDFFPGDVPLLAQLASEALPGQYLLLFEALQGDKLRGQAIDALAAIVETKSTFRPGAREGVELGRKRAQAAITLLRFGETDKALAVFRDREDQEATGQFVTRVKSLGVPVESLLSCLDRAREDRVRFALLLALGEYPFAEVPEPKKKELVEKLRLWYRAEPSSAIHGACEWLLRAWQLEAEVPTVPAVPAPPPYRPAGSPQWFVLNVGDERLGFVVFPPGQFTMGSPLWEDLRVADEKQHEVGITRPFAVLDREVTIALWQQFLKDTGGDQAVAAWVKRNQRDKKCLEPWFPACFLSWHEAVDLCRWLTRKAGMPESSQCYVPIEDRAGNRAKAGYNNWLYLPHKTGFRLPTEAEWEFACRAGTRTTYSFGSDPDLLKHFAVVLENSGRAPHKGGTRRPNPRGLFDVHGNVWEWCQDWHDRDWEFLGHGVLGASTVGSLALPWGRAPYLAATSLLRGRPKYALSLVENPTGPVLAETRLYRGGSYDNIARHGRSACRISDQPNVHNFGYVGIRVVCTLPAAP